MRTLGNIALISWMLLALFVFLARLIKGSRVSDFVHRYDRRLGIISVVLMATWIMLLALSGLFGASTQ